MLSFIILVLCLCHSISGELSPEESAFDKLNARALPFGDPDNLMDENPDNLQAGCDRMGSTTSGKLGEGAANIFTGLALEVVKKVMSTLKPDDTAWCKLLKKGEKDKTAALIKEINKHAKDGNPIRLGFLSSMDQHLKEGTGNIPELTCQLKMFIDKSTNIYSDDHGAKAVIKEFFDNNFTIIVKVLEEKRGPAAASCDLPDATSNPSEYSAFNLLLFKAIQKLDK